MEKTRACRQRSSGSVKDGVAWQRQQASLWEAGWIGDMKERKAQLPEERKEDNLQPDMSEDTTTGAEGAIAAEVAAMVGCAAVG